jgi:hypothetical protein
MTVNEKTQIASLHPEAAIRNKQTWRDSVLDCGGPPPLLHRDSHPKRQRAGALQNLAVICTIFGIQ